MSAPVTIEMSRLDLKKQVLLAGASPSERADFERRLRRSRTLTLTIAPDGAAIIGLLAAYQFDAVLMKLSDLEDAWSGLAYIHEVMSDLRIIGLLDVSDPALEARAVEAGIDEFLFAPFTAERLRRALSRTETDEAEETAAAPPSLTLGEVALKLHASLNLEDVLQAAVNEIFRLTPCIKIRILVAEVDRGVGGYEAVLTASGGAALSPLDPEGVAAELAATPATGEPVIPVADNRLLVHLRHAGRRVGLGLIEYPRRVKLKRMEMQAMAHLAEHLGLALANAAQHTATRRKRDQVFLINEISRQIARSLDLDMVLADIVDHLRRYTECDVVAIYTPTLAGRDGKNFHIASDLGGSTSVMAASIQGDSGMIQETMRRGETILCRDLRHAPGSHGHSTQSRSKIASPIWLNGVIEGVLEFESVRPEAFDVGDKSIIEDLALQISVAIRNTRLYRSAQAEHEYLQTVLDVAEDTAIISTDREGTIVTFSRGAEMMFGHDDRELTGTSVLPLFKGSTAHATIRQFLAGKLPSVSESDVRLRRRNGDEFYASVTMRPLRADRSEGFLFLLMDVTERRAQQELLHRLSITDELTNLYNKRYYFTILPREIARAQRHGSSFALCYFDLDGFKHYNDERGHVAGDDLLRWVGDLTQQTIRRQVDLPFRYGGDEFVLILPETNAEDARLVGQRICNTVREKSDGEVTVSFGIVEYKGESPEELTVRADRMMYAAKRSGGDRVITINSGEWKFQSGEIQFSSGEWSDIVEG